MIYRVTGYLPPFSSSKDTHGACEIVYKTIVSANSLCNQVLSTISAFNIFFDNGLEFFSDSVTF